MSIKLRKTLPQWEDFDGNVAFRSVSLNTHLGAPREGGVGCSGGGQAKSTSYEVLFAVPVATGNISRDKSLSAVASMTLLPAAAHRTCTSSPPAHVQREEMSDSSPGAINIEDCCPAASAIDDEGRKNRCGATGTTLGKIYFTNTILAGGRGVKLLDSRALCWNTAYSKYTPV